MPHRAGRCPACGAPRRGRPRRTSAGFPAWRGAGGAGARIRARWRWMANFPSSDPKIWPRSCSPPARPGSPRARCRITAAVVHAVFNFAAQSLMVLGHMLSQKDGPAHPPASLVAVPLFHVTGEVPLFLQSFALGRKLVMMPKWDALEAMRLIEAEQDHLFRRRAADELRDGRRIPCAAISTSRAARPSPPAAHRARSSMSTTFARRCPGAYPILGYGLTETNAVGCGNFNENYLAKPGSTGPASPPLVDLAILGEDGDHAPRGERRGSRDPFGLQFHRLLATIRKRPARPCATMAISAPATSAISTRTAICSSSTARRTSSSAAARTSPASKWNRRSTPIPRSPNVRCSACRRSLRRSAGGGLAGPGRATSSREEDLREFLAERLAPFKIPVRFWQETQALAAPRHREGRQARVA